EDEVSGHLGAVPHVDAVAVSPGDRRAGLAVHALLTASRLNVQLDGVLADHDEVIERPPIAGRGRVLTAADALPQVTIEIEANDVAEVRPVREPPGGGRPCVSEAPSPETPTHPPVEALPDRSQH